MRILIEEYQYKYEDVCQTLQGLDVLRDVHGKTSLGYVGYYYNPHPEVQDCVFILPKVLLEGKTGNEKVFGHIDPKDLINMEQCASLTREEHDFIYNLSVWIYRAISVFRSQEYSPRRGKKKNAPSIVLHQRAPEMGHTKRRKTNTYLDILLALQQWNKDNEHFVMFIVKNQHSGYNKINWTRTISHSQALLHSRRLGTRNQEVAYLDPINKKRQINTDEELLVIYYSILNHLKERYGFPIKININFDLIKGKKFERYLNGYGKARLKQIKYKYFSDKTLELWDLCYAFFEHPYRININVDQREYLLVKSFHVVFETIIDELIAGDQKLPKDLLDQEDGKRVDHMYQYHELTNNDEDNPIYYIGDSKYYKRGHKLGSESVYKQFTYARNVIQWNLDLFNDGDASDQKGHIPLRDNDTEGYNVIPNFFISAHQETLESDPKIKLTTDKKQYHLSRHFDNRLFDRDTFLIAHYDVNFLFVLGLYGRNKRAEKEAWREKVRRQFRKEIQEMLMRNFHFYAITPHENVDAVSYIQENFQRMLGKVFKPYEDGPDGQQYYSLALRNPESVREQNPALAQDLETENEGIRQVIDQYFYREDCALGINPSTVLPVVKRSETVFVPKEFRTRYYFEAYLNSSFLIGGYKSLEHFAWIFNRTVKRDIMYNVRIDKDREGSISKTKAKKAPLFLFLYNIENPNIEGLMMFRVHNAADTPLAYMEKTGYPNPHKNYVSYVLESDAITFGDFDIVKFLEDYKTSNPGYIKGAPIFLTGKDLIDYRI